MQIKLKEKRAMDNLKLSEEFFKGFEFFMSGREPSVPAPV
jgi:hypothetical protein